MLQKDYKTSLIALFDPSFSASTFQEKQSKKKNNYIKIGKVAEYFDLQPSVLRFWEEAFPQLKPLRSEKGQRLYSPEDIALIQKIKSLLHKKGMTIEGAKKHLTKNPLPVKVSKKLPKTTSQIKALSLEKPALSVSNKFLQNVYDELVNIKKLLDF